jgi:hypothetical protein
LRFFFVGGETTYRVVDAAGNRSTQIAYTDRGLDLTLTLGAGNGYTLTTGSGEITGDLVTGGSVAWMQFYNSNAGENTERNFYLGAMTHTVATTGERTVTASGAVTRAGSSAYGNWLGEVPASDEMLLNYAIGGASAPDVEPAGLQMWHDGADGQFVLRAIVREDAALAVAAKTTDHLGGPWTADGVTSSEPTDPQPPAPTGCKVMEYRVSSEGGRRFIRLEVTHAP